MKKSFRFEYESWITGTAFLNRRAMTTLTELGYLVKTDVKKPGRYGEMNYCWKLA